MGATNLRDESHGFDRSIRVRHQIPVYRDLSLSQKSAEREISARPMAIPGWGGRR